jgi:endo-1,4-beta-xylanase
VNYKRLFVLPLLIAVLFSGTAYADGQNLPVLHEIYADHFEIGFAARQSFWLDEPLLAHFNTVTPENMMKWEAIHPRLGVYTFGNADYLVKYAEDNGMNVVGHTLVWHSQTPDWVFTDENGNDLSREELLARMEDHIKTVVGRYKGRIKGWDVVNEAVEQNPVTGKWELRDSKWKQIIGDDFIEYAFKFAHEADPEAELYYNDYSATDPGKRDAIYNMVKGLLDKGIRVDGIGMQGHWDMGYPGPQQIKEAIELYSSLGVKVHITELDISVFAWNDRSNPYRSGLPEEVSARLAERYTQVFRVFKEYSDVIDRVTLWGVKDNHSWKNNFPVSGRSDYPLLFDSRGQAKPAFWGVVAAGLDEASWQDARQAFLGQ